MKTCDDCTAARETAGAWHRFDPACLYCGARLIQRIKAMEIDGKISEAEGKQRRRGVRFDWLAQGHDAAELNALYTAPAMAVAPITKPAAPAKKRKGKK